uniref:protein FAM216A-like isoform X1 n=1 Tax=Solea senegalensis TaxID=28829 RepID=UPI001CD84FB6|nr:protein FAM216A-like isoform X1 [Solea senegalensis]
MMRKRVTFVDHLKTESLSKNGSGHVLMRSAESNNRCTDGQQVRKIYREINRNALADSQHMTTVHIPKSVMSAPFLQHPALTTGQRRYLYSIANVYSTEHMRRQMKQHYLNVLHACLQTGQNPNCRRRLQCGENGTVPKDTEKDSEARAKPQGRRKGSSSSKGTARSDVILPKIASRRGM